MLSSVTINCQVTKIVMNSGSQLSELSQMSQVSMIEVLLQSCKVWFNIVMSGQFLILPAGILKPFLLEEQT